MKLRMLKNAGVTPEGQKWLLAGETYDFDDEAKRSLIQYLLASGRAVPVKEEPKKETATKARTNRETRKKVSE